MGNAEQTLHQPMPYATVGQYVVKLDPSNGEIQALHYDGSIFVGRGGHLDLGSKAHIRIGRDPEKQSQLTMVVSQKESNMLLHPVSVTLKPSIQTNANAFGWLQDVANELSAKSKENEELQNLSARQKSFIEDITNNAVAEREDILRRVAKVIQERGE